MTEHTVPRELIAGDTWSWLSEYADYPAGTWTAAVHLENQSASITANATQDATAHSFSITAATTAAYKAGRYRCRIRVTAAGVSKTIDEGWVEVLSDPAATGNRDHRSWARQTLDAIEATLLGRASSDQLNMTINNRSIGRTPLNELTQWRETLRAEVRAEEAGSKAGLGRRIKTRLLRG